MKAAYSSPLTSPERFEAMNRWFSNNHSKLTNELFPRDSVLYNEKKGVQEWFYALPVDTCEKSVDGFEIVDLPHGLFAVASCLDADLDNAADWLKTREEIMGWVRQSERFALYENQEGRSERYAMFHIVTPGRMIATGFAQEDLYIPIVQKESAAF